MVLKGRLQPRRYRGVKIGLQPLREFEFCFNPKSLGG